MTILLVFSCKKENATPNQPTELTPEISKSITLTSKSNKYKKLTITITGNAESVKKRITEYHNIEFDFLNESELKNVNFIEPKKNNEADSNSVSIKLEFVGFDNLSENRELKQIAFYNKTEKAWGTILYFNSVSDVTTNFPFAMAKLTNRTNRWYLSCLCRKYGARWTFKSSATASSVTFGSQTTNNENQIIYATLGRHNINNSFYLFPTNGFSPSTGYSVNNNIRHIVGVKDYDWSTQPSADFELWFWI